ncbi:hypothetical protein MGI18_10120 [Bacillus sp. OVS6]|nr:hypothetical protein MGI18_10120 [Bacillus sp. OVS6]
MKLTTALLTGALVIGGIGAGSQFIGPNDRVQAEKRQKSKILKSAMSRQKKSY